MEENTHTGFSTYLTFVRFLSRVDQVVLLEVGELSEAFLTEVTLERSLSAVHAQMNLQHNDTRADVKQQIINVMFRLKM